MDNRIVCPYCDELGSLEVQAGDELTATVYVDCEMCEGTGEIAMPDCPQCGTNLNVEYAGILMSTELPYFRCYADHFRNARMGPIAFDLEPI